MKRPLTPEEKKLWERVTQGDKRLRSNKDVKIERCEDVKTVMHARKKETVAPKNLHIPTSSHPHIPQGSYANIDRNTAERFRKGKYAIDATLDLHGLSRDKAQAALYHFLQSHHARDSRCLLVITGKGLILRESLPHWLAELRPMILAFDTAKQKHGGTGAFYILLRRKRRGKE